MKTLKRLRKINGVFWFIFCTALVTYVCIKWHAAGCEWYSLVAAIIFDGFGYASVGLIIDLHLREKIKNL